MMLKNYIKTAWRNARNSPVNTLINISSLTIGTVLCLLIFFWVQDELRYGQFHEKSDRIYRVLWDAQYGDNEWTTSLIPVPAAEALEKNFSEIDKAVRLMRSNQTMLLDRESVKERDFYYTEPKFFDVFTTEFLKGNPEKALTKPESVVITAETARRYFGNTAALGEVIERPKGANLTVTGVVKAWPEQSHFKFDFLAPLQGVSRFEQRRGEWGSATVQTYVLLNKKAQIEELEPKIQQYITGSLNLLANTNYEKYSLPLQPLTEIHLYNADGSSGDIVYVYLFSVIGLFVLLLACINFVNLTTARYSIRAQEVGVRKVLGAGRKQLVWQFLTETALYTLVSVFLALLLAEASSPFLEHISGKSFVDIFYITPGAIGGVFILIITIILLAGGYPAFILSSFEPVRVLGSRTWSAPKNRWLRNGLVLIQFIVAISLIASTFIVDRQLNFVQTKQLGFDEEHVLVLNNIQSLGDRYPLFLQEVKKLTHVKTASATQSLAGNGFDAMAFEPEQPSSYETTSIGYNIVDENYVDVLGLEMARGRNFSGDRSTDSSAVLINEKAAEMLGWEEPLGKRLVTGGGYGGEVIGVIKNFHYQSLHYDIAPAVFLYLPWQPSQIAVRLQPGNVPEAIASVQDVWEEVAPQQPFIYSFLEEEYQKLYKDEQQMANLFEVFSFLAIFIACIGLLGLVTFAAQRRTKEIGIRKVLGASVTNIVGLLSKDFLKLVVLGFVIAVAIAWYTMNRWLADFAYKIEIGPGIFLGAGGVAVLIALATVSWQSIRAALANPVDSLRSE